MKYYERHIGFDLNFHTTQLLYNPPFNLQDEIFKNVPQRSGMHLL